MENNFQIIIYIILGIIYFVFSILGENKNKKKPQPKKQTPKSLQDILAQLNQSPEANANLPQANQNREISLQNLLREIQAERNAQSKQLEVDENNSEEFFRDDYARRFEQGETFDNTKHPDFTKIKMKSNLIEEKRTTIVRKTNPYQKLLKQKNAAKQAFIFSEIFNRKF